MEHFCVKFRSDVSREFINRTNALLGAVIETALLEEENLFLLRNASEFTTEELIAAYSVLPSVEFAELPPSDRKLTDPRPDSETDEPLGHA